MSDDNILVTLVKASKNKSSVLSKLDKWDGYERRKLVLLILVATKKSVTESFEFLNSCNMLTHEMLLILEESELCSQQDIFDHINSSVDNFKLFVELIKVDFFSPLHYMNEVSLILKCSR